MFWRQDVTQIGFQMPFTHSDSFGWCNAFMSWSRQSGCSHRKNSPVRPNLDLWKPSEARWLMDLKDLIALHSDIFTLIIPNIFWFFSPAGCEVIFSLLAATVSLCCATLLWHKGVHGLLLVFLAWSSNSHLYRPNVQSDTTAQLCLSVCCMNMKYIFMFIIFMQLVSYDGHI